MEMVSAAKLRKAQNRLNTLKPYVQAMERIVANTIDEDSMALHPFLRKRTVKNTGLIVVASDRGLCGAYNANVLRAAEGHIEDKDSVQLITVGKKAAAYFRRRKYRILRSHIGFGGTFDASALSSVASAVVDDYLRGELDLIHIVYTGFESVTRRLVRVDQLLGIDIPKPVPVSNYIFEPHLRGFLADFLPRYVSGKLMIAVAEAFTSEHASRMVAMRAATDNAEEMINSLTLQLNRARQTAITKELADIVGGAEALK